MQISTFIFVLIVGVVLANENWRQKARQDGFGERRTFGREDNVPDELDDQLVHRDQSHMVKTPIDKHEKSLYRKLPLMKNKKKSLNMQSYFALWRDYKRQHSRIYETFEEEQSRFFNFIDNYEKVAEHNKGYENGQKSYRMRLNKYSDMNHKEFVATMNGYKRNLRDRTVDETASTFLPPSNFVAPVSVDWRQEGYVTPVKDQGHCGSCWAFSTTGALEGQHYRKSKQLVSLSEQNLVDCSSKYGNQGCNGGLMDNAFQYIKENHGLDTEKSYPYEAKDGKCRFKKQNIGAQDVGFQDVPPGNESALQSAVASVGPCSVAIDASHSSFQFYHEGVYNEKECSSEQLDHGVLVVGYGVADDGSEYWIVKNSWGATWGEDGYIKMTRNKENQCGIASAASYPLV